MNNIHVLDCTLRDGGYCNEWRFGFDNIRYITNGLIEAGIEIIECGFISNKYSYDPDVSIFSSIDEISEVIPNNKNGKLFVAMMNYGEYDIEDLPIFDGKSIDGIRVAFHKKNLKDALDLCEKIKEKGYLVFIQAMVSLSYSDEEFLAMIKRVNEFKPYAFYIVDSFGMMKAKDLIRLFYLIEHNLDYTIWVGFHCHNNMQLAFSNSQTLTSLHTNRNIIIDASVYGMGRGAGNLNTEIFLEYLNENGDKQYKLKPILILIDKILNDFYQKNYWGYSLPNYISASHNAHPNYASYLDDKKTLTIEGMSDIFEMMADDKKVSFDKSYIEGLYLEYMDKRKVQDVHKCELMSILSEKKILLIAPGKSCIDELNKIKDFIDSNTIIVSVNFAFEYIEPKFIFLSNLRRFRELSKDNKKKCIVTSNIPSDDIYFQTRYSELVNSVNAVSDNAGLMAIKFFMSFNIEGIYLAGFDGYSHDVNENYYNSDVAIITKNSVLDSINKGMINVLKQYKKKIKIEFVTKSHFLDI